MSFDLYLHASEDQTRKIPMPRVDAAIRALSGIKAISGSEYAFEGDGFLVQFEVEHETAAGGDVKGIYVHVPTGGGAPAFEKARELSLPLVDALELVIYDHEAGTYVAREAFASQAIAADGELFRAKAVEQAQQAAASAKPLAAAPRGGGCLGILLVVAGALPAVVAYIPSRP